MKRTKTPNRPKQSGRLVVPRAAWLWAVGLLLLVTAVYWPTLANGFVWDDDTNVLDNSTLRSLDGLRQMWFVPRATQQYYPLMYTSFWVEYKLWGLAPLGYHLVNLLLAAVAAVLVWRVLTRLGVPGAWLAAALFAVHPVNVESVAWITERKNLLSLSFVLLSMLYYLRFDPPDQDAIDAAAPHDKSRRRDYFLSLATFTLALFAKTAVVTLPAVLLVVYWWKRGALSRRDFSRLAPFFALAVALGLVTTWTETYHVGAAGEEWSLPAVERVLIAGRSLWFYAGKLFWPYPLVFFYPRWPIDSRASWQYLYPAAALAVPAALFLARGRIGRGPLAAVLIYAGVLMPVLGFFNIYYARYAYVSDHFQYQASIALLALAAAGLSTVHGAGRIVPQTSWAAALATIVVLAPWSIVAFERTKVYQDRYTLFETTLAQNPAAWVVPHYLGTSEFKRGNYDRAAFHAQHAIDVLDRLARLQPTFPSFQDNLAASYANLGWAKLKLGRTDDATNSFRQAMEIRERLARDYPSATEYQQGLAWSSVDLALAHRQRGQHVEALALFRKAVALRETLVDDHPENLKFKNDLAADLVDIGLALRDMGQSDEALSSLEKAAQIRQSLVLENPAVEDYRAGLAWCYIDQAIVHADADRPADAESLYQKAISLRERLAEDNPENGTYQNELATTCMDLGFLQRGARRQADAAGSFQSAIEIREKLAKAHPANDEWANNLAGSLMVRGQLQLEMARPEEANRSLRQAILIREKLVRDVPAVANYRADLASTYTGRGAALVAGGDAAGAVAACQRTIEILKSLVREFPDSADYQDRLGEGYTTLGTVQAAIGRSADAEVSFGRAAEIREKLAPKSQVTEGQGVSKG